MSAQEQQIELDPMVLVRLEKRQDRVLQLAGGQVIALALVLDTSHVLPPLPLLLPPLHAALRHHPRPPRDHRDHQVGPLYQTLV